MPDGRPKGFPSTRLEMKPPYGLAVAISDHQDGSFEQQEVSGRDVVASAKIIAVPRCGYVEKSEEEMAAMWWMVVALRKRWTGTGELMMGATGEGNRTARRVEMPTEADSDTKRVRFGVLLQTTTTGGCLAISGATPILPFLSAPGRFSCLY